MLSMFIAMNKINCSKLYTSKQCDVMKKEIGITVHFSKVGIFLRIWIFLNCEYRNEN